MSEKKDLEHDTNQSICGVDVADKASAEEAWTAIVQGVKELAKRHGETIPPMLTVCAVREALQWICGDLNIPVQAMLDGYRNALLSCSPPVDPHFQGHPYNQANSQAAG